MTRALRRLGLVVLVLAALVPVALAAGPAVLTGAIGRSGPGASPGSMGVAQIGEVAAGAGFGGNGLVMAIAVALAESGGDPGAVDHDANGTVDRGLWQINSVHTEVSASCNFDPTCAAAAAFAISDSGRDWSAWVTFRRGEEIAYLPAAAAWVSSGQGAS